MKRSASDLRAVYSKDVVTGRLKQLYGEQIGHVTRQIYGLLPKYRANVDEATYARERDKFMVLLECAREDSLSVQGLEAALKHLTEQRCVVAGALN